MVCKEENKQWQIGQFKWNLDGNKKLLKSRYMNN